MWFFQWVGIIVGAFSVWNIVKKFIELPTTDFFCGDSRILSQDILSGGRCRYVCFTIYR
jgi:hypothetical protein